MATSNRQYTNQNRVRSLSGNNTLSITTAQLDIAEEIVDLYCGDYSYPSVKAPFYEETSILTASFSSNVVTLASTENLETNYLKYTNIQIIESTDNTEEGYIYPVLSSTGLTLTIDNADTLTGSKTIKLFQLGKFPRVGDCELDDDNNKYFKWVPQEVSQAATYQAWYIIENPELFDNSEDYNNFMSESIGANGQYSYSIGSSDYLKFVAQADYYTTKYLSPTAKQLLSKYSRQALI